MKYLRRSIITLLLIVAVFFNIERLDFGAENLIDIHSFTYVLLLVAVISTLTVPKLWEWPATYSFSLWLGTYFVLRFLVFNEQPFIGGIHTYILISEISLLSVSIWSAHQLARQVYDFEEAVANITFTKTHRRVQPLEAALEDIQIEFTRSRRYQSPLSLVVVTPEEDSVQVALHRTVLEVQRAMMNRYVLTGMARVISMALRRTDMVVEQGDKGQFVILSPHTSAEELNVVVRRIQQAVGEQLGVSVHCGVASFPEDALTFEDLLKEAQDMVDKPLEENLISST